jgi:hypothetical protein
MRLRQKHQKSLLARKVFQNWRWEIQFPTFWFAALIFGAFQINKLDGPALAYLAAVAER